MNDCREKEAEIPFFNVVELAKKQSEAMKSLGVSHNVHSFQLKNKLLEECPDLVAISKPGCPNVVTFSTKPTYPGRDFETEGTAMLDVAKSIRSDIFEEEDESKSPPSLVALIKIITCGPSSSTNTSKQYDVVCQNIADLITYNTVKRPKQGAAFRKQKKCPKTLSGPVYLASKLYATTRKKKLIERAHQLGVCISYAKLQSIITETANKVCTIYRQDGVVAPLKLQKDLFTTAAVDNLDHNPSSTSAETAFHGTAITLMQHKMPQETGSPRTTTINIPESEKNTDVQLPPDYALVPPCFLDLKKFTCSKSNKYTHEVSATSLPLQQEQEWLEQTMSDTVKPWAAYHSAFDKEIEERHSTEVALLPVFREQSHSTAMMLHSMKMVEKSVRFLNPGQTPVLVADQPLYALLKQVQYMLPETVGEDKMFVMMGGLHLEMAGLKLIGQWLRGSGWIEAIINANITSSGRAEAMLNASHITRTRHAHQVTAAALYALQKKAYSNDLKEPYVSFEEWRLEKLKNIPQFKYWDMVLQLELLILQLVRSVRSGHFVTYLNALRRLVPWFFALDHVNYARWLSVHIRDLANMRENVPDLLKCFEAGKFVARRSDRPFSAMALDQAHEQINALVKGDGGMVGLTEKPDTLRKWLIAGPEIAAMVEDFESEVMQLEFYNEDSKNHTANRHHSDTAANQTKFVKMVKSLEQTLNDMSNPFLEETRDIYDIDSKKIASVEFVETVYNIENNGELQYINFCEERLKGVKSLQEPIKLNKYVLFSTSAGKPVNKAKEKIAGLKTDCSLFSKLYIATCEHRKGDLQAFFSHENQPYPPSLSSQGSLRSCAKSDLLKCLTNLCNESTAPTAPQVSAKILDGAAILHMMNPGQSRTFGEYADNIFIPFIQKELSTTQRVDIIWDRYYDKSIKNSTREKRGIGSRTKVCSNTKIPKGWPNFLRDNENKKELFHLLSLACHAMEVPAEKELNITDDMNVLSSTARCKLNIEPCNHEEADTRIMVHVADAVNQGLKHIMIRTVDTDVVVLAVSCVPKLEGLEGLWVHIGTGKNHQFLSCDKIAASLGPEKATTLSLFHALTGCDTVSGFNGKGKKTAFEAWNVYPLATTGFQMLADGDIENAKKTMEKFIITMYDKSSECSNLNDCRRELFSKKGRSLENIPPTSASFQQHLLRAMYQGVHVWGQALVPMQNLPNPAEWGWEMGTDGQWTPTWTTAPVAATACLELIRCKCKSRCGVRCNCQKRQLKCTELCTCSGSCNTLA